MLSINADKTWFRLEVEGGPELLVYAFMGREKLNEPYEFYEGAGSNTRKGRNAEGSATGALHEKGRHVYYNDETHTRGDDQDRKKGEHVEMSRYVYMTYRHPDDANMLTKDFVAIKLVPGDE